jgi:hypothetical protein
MFSPNNFYRELDCFWSLCWWEARVPRLLSMTCKARACIPCSKSKVLIIKKFKKKVVVIPLVHSCITRVLVSCSFEVHVWSLEIPEKGMTVLWWWSLLQWLLLVNHISILSRSQDKSSSLNVVDIQHHVQRRMMPVPLKRPRDSVTSFLLFDSWLGFCWIVLLLESRVSVTSSSSIRKRDTKWTRRSWQTNN